ncbi:MAG TPA: hypothetical protein VGD56_06965 [Gemmatirosa sp.]
MQPRTALDPDHVAAIDSVVRTLVQRQRRATDVGLFFSLGHSTVVVLATAGVAVATSALPEVFTKVRVVGQAIGSGVSAVFLLLIGAANLLVLRDVWRRLGAMRRGEPADPEMAAVGRGVVGRIVAPLSRLVSRSWHMYPLGFLFGLGFDTATEVGLLGISATQSANGLPVWSILVFPTLFTAGMTLVDTTDSVLMTGAYQWSLTDPLRTLWYNVTMTAASAAVALLIGVIESVVIVADRIGRTGPAAGGLWSVAGVLDRNPTWVGVGILVVFASVWLASAVAYRRARPSAGTC